MTPVSSTNTSVLSWEGIFAICGTLVFLGYFADWVLRRSRKDAILSGLRHLENVIANTPITQWQLIVASRALRLWTWLSDFVESRVKSKREVFTSLLEKERNQPNALRRYFLRSFERNSDQDFRNWWETMLVIVVFFILYSF